MEKWHDQLADQAPDTHRLAADALVLYYLFLDYIKLETKVDRVMTVVNWKLNDDRPSQDRIREMFGEGLGLVGTHYLAAQPFVIEYYLAFASAVRRDEADVDDPKSCQALADRLVTEIRDSKGARHILLHLLFPDDFEAIASDSHKQLLFQAFSDIAAGETDVDAALRRIRAALEQQYGHAISFYSDEVRSRWQLEKPPPIVPPKDGDPKLSPLDELVERSHLGLEELMELQDLLRSKKQLILEGPPGSGKTFVADLLARYVSGNPLDGTPNERLVMVQFHQSYGYEDFVQGIRPETNPETGRLQYHVRDGIFKRFCGRAASEPGQSYVMVVDEINRANMSRVFGELLLLLEYRTRSVPLAYSEPDAEAFRIPENLYLVGTMNTADRSLAQIDYALRRRFFFYRLSPMVAGRAPVLERWLTRRGVPEEQRREVLEHFITLNMKLETELGEDFVVGHSYFMDERIGDPVFQQAIWRRAIRPLLVEYFYSRRDRAELLTRFDAEALLPANTEQSDLVAPDSG
jgi:MoxR-like ATPase